MGTEQSGGGRHGEEWVPLEHKGGALSRDPTRHGPEQEGLPPHPQIIHQEHNAGPCGTGGTCFPKVTKLLASQAHYKRQNLRQCSCSYKATEPDYCQQDSSLQGALQTHSGNIFILTFSGEHFVHV